VFGSGVTKPFCLAVVDINKYISKSTSVDLPFLSSKLTVVSQSA